MFESNPPKQHTLKPEDIMDILQSLSDEEEYDNSDHTKMDDMDEDIQSNSDYDTSFSSYDEHESIDSSDWDSTDDENNQIESDNNNNNTSLELLLFSEIRPYKSNDYRNIENNQNEDEQESMNENIDATMNWNDVESVNKIKELISNLLLTASSNIGIKEDELYLMFTTPSPQSIIQHLRFGLLSNLCTVNMDRFGRRSYHYQNKGKNNTNIDQCKIEINHHFFCDSELPSKLNVLLKTHSNMYGLCQFIDNNSSSLSVYDANIQHIHSKRVNHEDMEIIQESPE